MVANGRIAKNPAVGVKPGSLANDALIATGAWLALALAVVLRWRLAR